MFMRLVFCLFETKRCVKDILKGIKMKSCLDMVLVATVAIELIVMAKSAIVGDL